MNLEITGTLLQVMPEVTGQGQKGPWVKQEFVVEIPHEKFPRKICFSIWGDKTSALKAIQPGATVKVYFNLESREYQGRWYTEARAWQINSANQPANPSSATATSPSPTVTASPVDEIHADSDDLPF